MKGRGMDDLDEVRYVRVLAGDVQVGDVIARTRTETFYRVTDVRRGEVSVWLTLDNGPGEFGGRIRPRATARLWRVLPAVATHETYVNHYALSGIRTGCRAGCKCGWRGERRVLETEAITDARAHRGA